MDKTHCYQSTRIKSATCIKKVNNYFTSSVWSSTNTLSIPKTQRNSDYFPQFREILLSRASLGSVHLCLLLFLYAFLTVSLTLWILCLSFPPSVSTGLFLSLSVRSFPNGAAKLLFPSHYLICASPLSCKSSRYSFPFSINSTAVRLQLPITKHC